MTSDIVGKIPNMRPLDAGELSMATPIESFTAVLLQLNVHYKTRVALKLTGIPEAVAPTAAGAATSAGDGSGAAPVAGAPAPAKAAAGRKGNGASGAAAAAEPTA